jgi:hypothetical protein
MDRGRCQNGGAPDKARAAWIHAQPLIGEWVMSRGMSFASQSIDDRSICH